MRVYLSQSTCRSILKKERSKKAILILRTRENGSHRKVFATGRGAQGLSRQNGQCFAEEYSIVCK